MNAGWMTRIGDQRCRLFSAHPIVPLSTEKRRRYPEALHLSSCTDPMYTVHTRREIATQVATRWMRPLLSIENANDDRRRQCIRRKRSRCARKVDIRRCASIYTAFTESRIYDVASQNVFWHYFHAVDALNIFTTHRWGFWAVYTVYLFCEDFPQ